jgi:hypothetical protein
MTTTRSGRAAQDRLRSPLLPCTPVLLLLALAGGPGLAQAADLALGENWRLSSKTSLSLGSSWALRDPDKRLMTPANARLAQGIGDASGAGISADDNRLNFDKHDAFTQVVKGISDFSLDGPDLGAFLRVKYWYDHAYETRDGKFKDFDDSGWPELAKVKGFAVLDAYLWKDLELAERPLGLKLGKQVLSWGEALLIHNGINVINPLDASAFNRPGVEIKEAQLPVEMLSFSYGLSDRLNLEGFYQYHWRPSVLDGCGTFFSPSDVIQPGCGPIFLNPALSDAQMQAAGLFVAPRGNQSPADGGQYGLALRGLLPALNDAEATFYYLNYHARLPYLTVTARDPSRPGDFPGGIQGPNYAAAFPEDIRLYGFSLNGVEPNSGIALAGELSYRPNLPLGFNGPDTIATLLQGAAASTGIAVPAGFALSGRHLDAWTRKPVWQLSGSATQVFDNLLGATRLTLYGEAGLVHVGELGDQRLGRNAAFGRSARRDGAPCNPPAGQVSNRFCTDQGFTTPWSWGYRLRASLEYSDVLPGLNLIPTVNYRHDVEGYAYDPGGPFQEGQQALGLALTFNYLNDYSLELGYHEFFGSNRYSILDDRDFVSVSLKADF